jgi:hypothetical protein
VKPSQTRTFRIRLAERVFWTAVQAGLALVTVEALDVAPAYAVLVAGVLATIKGYVASRLGDPYDPATLPAGA